MAKAHPSFDWTFDEIKTELEGAARPSDGRISLCIDRSSQDNIEQILSWARTMGWTGTVSRTRQSVTLIQDSDPVRNQALQDKAYAAYQADWMRTHGYSPRDLVRSVLAHLLDDPDAIEDLKDASRGMSIPGLFDQIFDDWEQNSDFGGSVWACKDEFLDGESKNKAYVANILSGTSDGRRETE